MSSSLGRQMPRTKAIEAVFDIMEINGLEITPEERQTFLTLDEPALVYRLVDKMSQEFRQTFEPLAKELSSVVVSVARIRNSLERKDVQQLKEVIEEGDRVGIVHQVLKKSVVQASREVANLKKCASSWEQNTIKRLARLQSGVELAEHAHQQLVAVESQLSQYQGDQKDKAKGVLMGLADGQNQALMHSCFSSWNGYVLKHQAEKGIRMKYEQMAKDAEDKLIQFQERHLSNIKGVLMRKAASGDEVLMHMCMKCWIEEIETMKREGGTAAEMNKMQDQLKAASAAQSANAHKTMTRLAADKEGTLVTLCMQAWLQFSAEYKKDKEMQDAVKKSELAIQEHLKKKKEEAKQVLDRMNAGSDQGLLAMIMGYWIGIYNEGKKAGELERQMEEMQGKFNTLKGAQGQKAMNAQNRVNEMAKTMLITKCLAGWVQETKANLMIKKYTNKIEAKRKQLNSVQTLFKSFAMQLEQGLGGVDGDSSGRRMSRKSSQLTQAKLDSMEKPPLMKGPDAVSLPPVAAS